MFAGKLVRSVLLASAVLVPAAAAAADLYAPRTVAPAPATVARSWADGWFVHVGPAGVVFSPGATVNVNGAPVTGTISVPSNVALGADIGYFITPDISASITLANPPTATINGKNGTVGTLGTLGKTTYLPPVLAAQYHFRQLGAFQPYIGAGVNYTMFLSNSDGALANFRVRSNLAPVVQIGADVMLNQNFGLFVDVKHAWLRTTAAGTLAGAPVDAKVTLDPTIIHGGIAYRF